MIRLSSRKLPGSTRLVAHTSRMYAMYSAGTTSAARCDSRREKIGRTRLRKKPAIASSGGGARVGRRGRLPGAAHDDLGDLRWSEEAHHRAPETGAAADIKLRLA